MCQANTAARATVTTTLAAASGGVLGLFIKYYLPAKLGGSHVYDIGHTCNSLLGGLVGITAGCATVRPWAALIIGFVAAWVYHAASCLMRKLKIDDPLDAFAVHGACGVWGMIAVGLFTAKEYSYSAKIPDAGIFMEGTRGELFGNQIVGVLMILLWVVIMSILLFGALRMAGIFRVPVEDEESGLDISKHGGSAYASDVDAPNHKVATASTSSSIA
uniref:Ammonium transporter AmtB-like domain-containing protein n=1 Tax=Haptolina brevifila TaxID=156173 RepID=A0A6U7L756_9EUKA|mmetsp:Transcript_72534/g.144073  ORF Transcript_72534/g.144073 Transcript_72534/m.144073 type:complete len:217 (+) Transcript_72534:1285-1935(+)